MENIKEIDTDVLPKEDYIPFKPTHYQFKNTTNITLLPIRNIMINYDVKKYLQELRECLHSEYFDPYIPKIRERLIRLNPTMRILFIKIIYNRTNIEPINVQRTYEINDPSLIDHNRPSVLGLETAYLTHQLRDIDYLYTPIDKFQLIALSLFFKYDHIPAIIHI